MNKIYLLVIAVIISLSGCSSSNDTATNTPSNNTQNNALSGYKDSLDAAKAVSSMAEANEKKKNQAIQDLQ